MLCCLVSSVTRAGETLETNGDQAHLTTSREDHLDTSINLNQEKNLAVNFDLTSKKFDDETSHVDVINDANFNIEELLLFPELSVDDIKNFAMLCRCWDNKKRFTKKVVAALLIAAAGGVAYACSQPNPVRENNTQQQSGGLSGEFLFYPQGSFSQDLSFMIKQGIACGLMTACGYVCLQVTQQLGDRTYNLFFAQEQSRCEALVKIVNLKLEMASTWLCSAMSSKGLDRFNMLYTSFLSYTEAVLEITHLIGSYQAEKMPEEKWGLPDKKLVATVESINHAFKKVLTKESITSDKEQLLAQDEIIKEIGYLFKGLFGVAHKTYNYHE